MIKRMIIAAGLVALPMMMMAQDLVVKEGTQVVWMLKSQKKKQTSDAELEADLAALFRKWSLQEIADFMKGLNKLENFQIAEGVLLRTFTPAQLQSLYALMSASPDAYAALPWSNAALAMFTAGNATSSGNSSLADADVEVPSPPRHLEYSQPAAR